MYTHYECLCYACRVFVYFGSYYSLVVLDISNGLYSSNYYLKVCNVVGLTIATIISLSMCILT